MFVRHLVILSFLALALHARADNNILYECVDANGNKQFTNIPANPKACRVLSIGPTAPPSAAAGRAPAKPQVATTPSQFPRVDREMQRQRDNDRLRILENELGTE